MDQIHPYVLCPYPGTAYGDYPGAYGIAIVNHRYEHYIEEGGYPTYRTSRLTRAQIYLYYLLADRTIRMAQVNRHLASQSQANIPVANSSPSFFHQFFTQIRKDVEG